MPTSYTNEIDALNRIIEMLDKFSMAGGGMAKGNINYNDIEGKVYGKNQYRFINENGHVQLKSRKEYYESNKERQNKFKSQYNSAQNEIQHLRRLIAGLTEGTDEYKKQVDNLNKALNKQADAVNGMKKSEAALKAREEKIGNAISAASKAIASAGNMAFELISIGIKKQNIKLEAAGELMQRRIQVYGNAITKSTEVMVANATDSIFNAAYKSYGAVMQSGMSFMIKDLQDATTMQKQATELAKARIDETMAVVNGVSGTVGAVLSLNPVGAMISGVMDSIVGLAGKWADVAKAKLDMHLKQVELANEATESQIKEIVAATDDLTNLAETIEKKYMEVNNMMFDYGRTMFLSADGLRKFSSAFVKTYKNIATVGMTPEEYMNAQKSYVNSTQGRNMLMSDQDARFIGGLSKALNIAPDEAASIAGSMEIFNHSISSSTDMVYQISKTVTKMGLNSQKFAKDLEKNLKMAERYQFKGGVKGMMEMAAWAQKVRLDMNSLTGALDKMMSGNIEDILQTSGRLNVLGGAAAMYSDPIQMMYNAAADPEQFAKNIQKSVAGFGTFDKKTGETKFSHNEIYRMRAIASAYGMDYGELMNMARQANKEQAIRGRFGNKFGGATDLLTQRSFFNEKTGQWQVNVRDDKSSTGFRAVDISSLKGENDPLLESIMPEDKQELLVDYVREIKNYLSDEQQQKVQETIRDAAILQSTYNGLEANNKERLNIAEEDLIKNLPVYAQSVIRIADATTETQRLMLEINGENRLKLLSANIEHIINAYKAHNKAINELTGAYHVWIEEGYEGVKNMFRAEFGLGKNDPYSELYSDLVDDFQDARGFSWANDWSNNNDLTNAANAEFSDPNTMLFDLEAWDREAHSLGYITALPGFLAAKKNMEKLPIDPETGKRVWRRASDFYVSPKHGIYELDPEDSAVFSKPGGSIDQSRKSESSNINLNLSGNFTLTGAGVTVDFMKRLDDLTLRELAYKAMSLVDADSRGGRPMSATIHRG